MSFVETFVGAMGMACLLLLGLRFMERQKLLEVAYTYAGSDKWARYLREIPASAGLAYRGIRMQLNLIGSQARSIVAGLQGEMRSADLDFLRASEEILSAYLRSRTTGEKRAAAKRAAKKLLRITSSWAMDPSCPEDLSTRLIQWKDDIDCWLRVVTILVPSLAFDEDDKPAAP